MSPACKCCNRSISGTAFVEDFDVGGMAVIHQIPASTMPEQALSDLDPSLSGPGGEGTGTLL